MKNIFLSILFLVLTANVKAQTNQYSISFENAVHHEAEIKATFPDLAPGTLSVRMGRSSPGRYAIHEFAKNVYNFKATDSNGKLLKIQRPNPYQWDILEHNGEVTISYTLFANRGDGTYAQIDETHAHLNIPATFMYAPALTARDIKVDFKVREDLNWKVATQMQQLSATSFAAPNFQYFMDSPVEISNHAIRQFEVEDNGTTQTIEFVLHHNGTEAALDTYFEQVKKIVLAQRDVFGELPQYDFNKYTFLACYIPNASGDGMEHRNSTILTDTEGLEEGGMKNNIGTVSHEFFHGWNVERIRPQSLEPFNYAQANMSGELWFAEGFTSYYTNFILCRAGIITPAQYVEGITGTFNYVWTSPARQFFNPIEMSYQAPFVDAATSVDPVNRENTFISYYSYGSVLGLALDLSLRQEKLNLDDYMKLVWQNYGKDEIPYTVADLHTTLAQYAGKDFSDQFFNNYIYESGMPDYENLFASVGVVLKQHLDKPYFGASVSVNQFGSGIIQRNPSIGGPAYAAALSSGDVITSINNMPLTQGQSFNEFIEQFKVGDTLTVAYTRYGVPKTTKVVLGANPAYSIHLMEKEGDKPSRKVLKARKAWLKTE
ncbi:Predicted metalloprotease, contains C-terminal PDZ domain [Arenibacter nanhaiticus]|uniref:Predicted metalloprotease, contains C-terminal PDZ domain n=1 Tax=Arenibacter nanhaiticus TaxID=558155 RepID=A0A1M6JHB6_9FLAO|nr:PDZ domain-containing protein [Arenibacter nanhaiticus]SHJ46119.1 Predicted metalloprotease, contains C-terminal PDZ domain [Arenibacter nanhaiticus]